MHDNYFVATKYNKCAESIKDKFLDLHHSFKVLDYAKVSAVIAKNNYEKTFHVFDILGNIIYTAERNHTHKLS